MGQKNVPTGIGIGLRHRMMDAIERGEADGEIAFLEISPENHMHRGGAAPARFERVAERFPVITHSLALSLGGIDPFEASYLGEMRRFLERFGGTWHSDHLCFTGTGGRALHDLLPIPFTQTCVRRVADRIREVQDRLAKPMLVENISYYQCLGRSEMDEATFVAEVLERADCGLLLDVNNVYVNARNHGIDPYQWLATIPLHRVRQLHVAGHERWDDTMWIDTHGAPVLPEVQAMMAWVIERIGPTPVLLERDRNIPPLAEMLQEVRALDAVYQDAVSRYHSSKAARAQA
ncbi:MAG: DUF692 domain-containing protein [Nannocystaceae bacterium]